MSNAVNAVVLGNPNEALTVQLNLDLDLKKTDKIDSMHIADLLAGLILAQVKQVDGAVLPGDFQYKVFLMATVHQGEASEGLDS